MNWLTMNVAVVSRSILLKMNSEQLKNMLMWMWNEWDDTELPIGPN